MSRGEPQNRASGEAAEGEKYERQRKHGAGAIVGDVPHAFVNVFHVGREKFCQPRRQGRHEVWVFQVIDEEAENADLGGAIEELGGDGQNEVPFAEQGTLMR